LTPQEQEHFRANRFEIVSRLADDLAHEIKNPLNAIIINLEVLKVRVAGGDSAAAADRAAVIELETRRLHDLVDRLLQLMRPSREEAASLPLDQALDEVLPLVQLQARLARNEFTSRCTATVFVPVPRDVFKFAMLNVLMATHELLGDGGGAFSLDCSADDDSVRIEVRTTESATGVVAPVSAAFERAVRVARDLLDPCGASVEAVRGGVTIVLPRGAAV
jgi:signal transduction histidine kinase